MSNPISRIKKVGVSSEKDNFDNQIRQWFPIASPIGLAVGIVMAGFHVLIVMLTWIFRLPHPVFWMFLGGLIIIIIQYFKFENPDHNGITYVISRRHSEDIIPINVGAKKFASSSLTIAAGLPVGREGPALILGSSIASKIVEWTKVPEDFRHQAITVGSAAATGALFQAPFGSAVFSAEVPYKEDSDEGMLMSAFLSSVIAAITASTLINFISKYKDVRFHILNIPEAKMGFTFQNAFLAIMLGILIGLVSRLFIEFYYWYSDKLIVDYSVHTKLIIGFSIFLSSMLLALINVPDLYLLGE